MKRSSRKNLALICALTLAAAPLSVNVSALPALAEETVTAQYDAASSIVTQEQIEKIIVGKWIVSEIDDNSQLTNEKVVYDIQSTEKAYISLSMPDTFSRWENHAEGKLKISGNVLSVSYSSGSDVSIEQDFSVISMSDNSFTANLKGKRTIKGSEPDVIEKTVTFVRVDDYSDDVIGTWEGRCTSEGSVFDDGKEHRWEYKKDGTYVYYIKDGDKWVPSENEMNEYFVAGNLLCTRWTENGKENREWWEIKADGGKMSWTALRADDDGSTYTVTFEMNKVVESSGEVTQEQIEKNIIGTWIVAEADGKSSLTNDKRVIDFVSATKAYGSFSSVNNTDAPFSNHTENTVSINGDVVTLSFFTESGALVKNELTITDISGDRFTANCKGSVPSQGAEPVVKNDVQFVKIEDDYSDAVLGTWEGRCTSAGSVFDDGKEHRWEYKKDGTYVYYNKDGGKWVPAAAANGDYFVAGNLLCTRWTDNGKENREWWEIKVDGGVMSWTALRANDDGSTYTAAFEMKKVGESSGEVTQEQIEQNIVGKWIVSEVDETPQLTNEKVVYDIQSTDKVRISLSTVDTFSPWENAVDGDLNISGNILSVTYSPVAVVAIEQKYAITSMSTTSFTADFTGKRTLNGSKSEEIEKTVSFVRVDDYSGAVIGTWEGRCTSEGSVFDDGKAHRWEYKKDGTYVYYNMVGDKWVPSDNESNEYFVAGNLLCMRWTDNGKENREWWEIKSDGNQMAWTALRANDDGSTYTASFEMDKVDDAAQEQVPADLISPARMCEMAAKDYQAKHENAAVTAEVGAKNADGTVRILLKDASGKTVDTYTVDPKTGVGTDSTQKEVNLPQTGVTSAAAAAAVAGAMVLTAAGFWMMRKASRREDDEI